LARVVIEATSGLLSQTSKASSSVPTTTASRFVTRRAGHATRAATQRRPAARCRWSRSGCLNVFRRQTSAS
jgi:hypothetical protein